MNKRVGGVLAVLVAFVATLSVVFAGIFAKVEIEGATNGALRASAPEPATVTPDLGVRALPLVVPGGAMASLPRDRPITIEEGPIAMGQAVGNAGLTPALPALYRAMDSDLRAVRNKGSKVRLSEAPYRYPAIDLALARSLSDAQIAARPPEVWVDLAAVLTVSAAQEVPDQFGHQASAMLAYAVLNRVRKVHETCDVQLQFAHLQSLGMYPSWAATDAEFRRAVELCGDDPTPLVVLGMWHVTSFVFQGDVDNFPGSQSSAATAREVFEELDRRLPELPLGPAGLAEVALVEAETWDSNGVRPFAARARYQEALHQVAIARSRSATYELLLAQARAELGLGRAGNALTLADDFLKERPGAPAGLAVKSEALIALRDFKALAAHAAMYGAARVPNGTALGRGDFGGYLATAIYLPTMVSQQDVAWSSVTDATLWEGGGLVGGDLGFLPEHREDPLRAAVWRGDDLRLTAVLLTGDRAAFADTAQWLTGKSILGLKADIYPSQIIVDSARDEWEGPLADGGEQGRFEWRQDLWRSVGDWDRAAKATEQWTNLLTDDGFGWDRRGEVAFLARDYDAAIKHFTRAIPLLEAVEYGYDPTLEQLSGPEAATLAKLKMGAAQEAMGQSASAEETYVSVRHIHPKDTFYGASQLGLLRLKEERFAEAIEPLQRAVAVAEEHDAEYWEEGAAFFLKGVQENNLALALIENGQAAEAVPIAEGALSRDAANPIFLDTLAYAHSRAGDASKARGAYETALAADKTNYLARNNLGVLLGEAGEHAAAREQFVQAVSINPKYALAWQNLGVALASAADGSFLGAQAAFREAAANDTAYRGAGLGYQLDTAIYDSGFDASRALRPDWSIGEASKRQPVGLSLVAVVIALIVAARAFITDDLASRFAAWLADDGKRGGWRRVFLRQLPVWLVLVVGPLAMAVSFWRNGRLLSEILGVATFTVAAVSSAVLLRWATAARRTYAWTPSLIATGVLLPFGAAFAPMPCGEADRGWRRWAPTVLLASMSTILLLAAVFVPAPIVRFSALVAVTLTACLLLPVRPHDGGFLPRKWWTALISVPLAVSALALSQAWI